MTGFNAWLRRWTRRLAERREVRATAHHAAAWVAWLQRHPNPWLRRGAALAFILGGIFAFLPILGVWMLPVGLIVLSDDIPVLRRARRRLLVRFGRWAKDHPPHRKPAGPLRVRPRDEP